MPTDIAKLPLGGPAWLRAIAEDKHEMLHALGSCDMESEREEKREILGLRDAATRMERGEVALTTVLAQLKETREVLAQFIGRAGAVDFATMNRARAANKAAREAISKAESALT